VVFSSLIVTYYYFRSGSVEWPQGGISPPDLLLPTINAFILFASSIPVYLADSGIKKGKQMRLRLGMTTGILLAIIFLVLKYIEYSGLPYAWDENAYTSIVWTITGFHSAHVIALVMKTTVIAILAWQGYFNEERNAGVSANGLYWHFVVIIWIPLFFTLYIAPRLI
jgi:cytochrome c oxidase subunit III